MTNWKMPRVNFFMNGKRNRLTKKPWEENHAENEVNFSGSSAR